MTLDTKHNLSILPDSRSREQKGSIQSVAGYQVPIHCASCHQHAGWCPGETTFLFYLCDTCFAKYGEETNFAFMPDEVFFAQVQRAQGEEYGHALDAIETEIQLGDPNSLESRLAKDRKFMTPTASS